MPNGEIPNSRYHGELKLTIEGHEARINVFADNLQVIFRDIGTIASQFPPDWKNPAKREIMNAELKANQLNGKSAAKPAETGEIPVCQNCGTNEFMERITFPDKRTGNPKQAWKCQQCQKWHWPNNNGKGR